MVDNAQKIHALRKHEECLPASVLGASLQKQHYNLSISSTFSILNLPTWVDGWISAVGIILTPYDS